MLKQLLEKKAALTERLKKVFAQAKGDDFSLVTEVSGTTEEKLAAVRAMNDELGKLGKQIDDLRILAQGRESIEAEEKAAEEAARKAGRPGMPAPGAPAAGGERKERLAFGTAILKAAGHNYDAARGIFEKVAGGARLGEGCKTVTLDGFWLKTLFERGAGWDPEVIRSGRLVDFPVRPIQVMDILPMQRATSDGIKYMEETTRTETNVVEKAEGVAYGEMALALTERSVTIEKIPAYLPVTDEQLADVPQAESYINNRLPEAVRRRLDYQAINGTGVTPLLLGVTQKSGIQTTAAGVDDATADHIARAIKDVSVTGRAIASAVIMHPTDYLNERLRKTKDGAYIWGNPSMPGPTQMWGLPIAQADSLTAGKAVVGDFRQYSAFVEREGMVVKMGWVNDDFIKGRNAVVAYLRGAFVWYRPEAFDYITLPA